MPAVTAITHGIFNSYTKITVREHSSVIVYNRKKNRPNVKCGQRKKIGERNQKRGLKDTEHMPLRRHYIGVNRTKIS